VRAVSTLARSASRRAGQAARR